MIKMGSAAGKHDPVKIDEELPGYCAPAPPSIYIDDIRPPIPWYQDDPPREEFDWASLSFSHDVLLPSNAKAWPSSATTSTPRTPSSVIRASSVYLRSLTNTPTRTDTGRKMTIMNMTRARGSTSTTPRRPFQGFRHRRPVPSEQKISFVKADERARSVEQQHTLSFSLLVKFLSEPFQNQLMRETLVARAMIVWLANQKTTKFMIGQGDKMSPKGLLRHIHHGTMSHAAVYTLLCREAGLQCVLVEGISRSGDYGAGGGRAICHEDVWTAVKVDGSWQLVHPYWICKGLEGSGASYRDWVKMEAKQGQDTKKDLKKTVKEIRKTFINEDFFMPAPEVFIYTCYSDDKSWQLLPEEQIVKSRDEFMSLPLIYPAFFRFGLLLTSEPSCVLQSSDGVSNISLVCELQHADRIVLSYKLILLFSKITNPELILANIQRCVVLSRNENKFNFEVRFPIEGIYRLEISGGFYKSHQLRLCHFKLVCKERKENFKYIPVKQDSRLNSFGHGPICDEIGLILPSIPNGVVWCYRENRYALAQDYFCFQPKDLSFKIDIERSHNTDFVPELVGISSEDFSDVASPFNEDGFLKEKIPASKVDNKLANTVTAKDIIDVHALPNSMKVTQKGEDLMIRIVAPFDGEMALIIWAEKFKIQKNGTKTMMSRLPICAYMLKTFLGLRRESVPQKLARHELEHACKDDIIETLETAINKAHHVAMDSDSDELVAAKRKLEFLQFKRDIHHAIHRRNMRIIHNVLGRLSKYRHRRLLVSQIRRLFSLQKQIRRLYECRHHLPELREALRKIEEIPEPPLEVHIPIAAMFLVLGESEKHIDDWSYVLKNLRCDEVDSFRLLDDPPILRKLPLVAELDPPKTTRRKIHSLLNEFTLGMIESVCQEAAVIYSWVSKVMSILEQVDYVTDAPASIFTAENDVTLQSNTTAHTATSLIYVRPQTNVSSQEYVASTNSLDQKYASTQNAVLSQNKFPSQKNLSPQNRVVSQKDVKLNENVTQENNFPSHNNAYSQSYAMLHNDAMMQNNDTSQTTVSSKGNVIPRNNSTSQDNILELVQSSDAGQLYLQDNKSTLNNPPPKNDAITQMNALS